MIVVLGICLALPALPLASHAPAAASTSSAAAPLSSPPSAPTVPQVARLSPGGAASPASGGSPPADLSLLRSYFRENLGEAGNPAVRYFATSGRLATGFGVSSVFVNIAPDRAPLPADPRLRLRSPPHAGSASAVGALVTIEFAGARQVAPTPEGQAAFTSHFVQPGSGAVTSARNFDAIVFPDLYPGIDLVYTTGPEGVKYRFEVAPGADASAIQMVYHGTDGLALDASGVLHVQTAAGPFSDAAPVSTEAGGLAVACAFDLRAVDAVGFACADRDASRALTIDPLVYATYLGGTVEEFSYSVAADANGSAVVLSYTDSFNFPSTNGAYDTQYSGGYDTTVTKFTANGKALVFSTFLGGSSDEYPWALALDANEDIFVAGTTSSSDFPTTPGSIARPCGGSSDPNNTTSCGYDAFASKLSPGGDRLLASTYLGGSSDDYGYGIAVDANGSVYVSGDTRSTDFPLVNGSYNTDPANVANWSNDAFLVKLSPNFTAMGYGTYLGGSGDEEAFAAAVDANGRAFVAGYTDSSDFPTTAGAYQAQQLVTGGYDGFVTKLSADGKALVYSTFLGGTSDDFVYAMAVDSAGSAYLTGQTYSGDFPVSNGAYDTSYGNGFSFNNSDAFVTKLNPAGSALQYSTYLGGSDYDGGYGIAVSRLGEAYAVGYTSSTDFPTTPDAVNQTYSQNTDGYLAILNSAGSDLQYGAYIGGSDADYLYGVGVDANLTAYVAGYTQSTDLPVTPGAYQGALSGWSDGFAAKISFPPIVNITVRTVPPGLVIEAGGGAVPSNTSFDCAYRGNLTMNAPSPQGSNGTRFIFESWSDGGAQNHTVRCYTPGVFVAFFRTEFQVNISTDPPGRDLLVDGGAVAVPVSYWWTAGSSHTFNVSTPQTVAETRYVFANWSDSGARNHAIFATGPLNLTLNFTTEYRVTLQSSPASRLLIVDGAAALGPTSWWWQQGSQHDIQVPSPQVVGTTRYQVLNWSDGGAANRTLTASSPAFLTAAFSTEYWAGLTTFPAGRDLIVDGNRVAAPQGYWWYQNSLHTAEAATPQGSSDARFIFDRWTNGMPANQTLLANGSWNLTAVFHEEFRVSLATFPPDLQVTVDGAVLAAPVTYWWDENSVHTINAESIQGTVDTRFVFTGWSDRLERAHTLDVTGAGNYTASFQTQYRVLVEGEPAGYPVYIDDLPATPPLTLWWVAGSTHKVGADAEIVEGSQRQVFASWSDGGDRVHNITVGAPASLKASFGTEYRVRVQTARLDRLLVVVDDAEVSLPRAYWWAAASSHTLSVPSPQGDKGTRFVFSAWQDGPDGASRTVQVKGPANYTVVFDREFEVDLSTVPSGIQLRLDEALVGTPITVWWAENSTHVVEARADVSASGQQLSFDKWEQGSGSVLVFHADRPLNLTAQYLAVKPAASTADAGLSWLFIGVAMAAGAGAVGFLVGRRRRAEGRAAALDEGGGAAAAPVAAGGGAATAAAPDIIAPYDEAPPPAAESACPRCQAPVAFGEAACGSCGLELTWG